MSDKKKFSEWEKEKGLLYIKATDKQLAGDVTEQEFLDAVVDEAGHYPHSLNWDDRTKFLQDNGYDLTRENYINPDLSARPGVVKKKK